MWRQYHIPKWNHLLSRSPGGVPQLPGLCVERQGSSWSWDLHQFHRPEHRAHLRLHHRLVGAADSHAVDARDAILLSDVFAASSFLSMWLRGLRTAGKQARCFFKLCPYVMWLLKVKRWEDRGH